MRNMPVLITMASLVLSDVDISSSFLINGMSKITFPYKKMIFNEREMKIIIRVIKLIIS